MFAKPNHVAIVSDNYAAQGAFHKALFELKTGSTSRFDRFGIQVEDIETVRERVAKQCPTDERDGGYRLTGGRIAFESV